MHCSLFPVLYIVRKPRRTTPAAPTNTTHYSLFHHRPLRSPPQFTIQKPHLGGVRRAGLRARRLMEIDGGGTSVTISSLSLLSGCGIGLAVGPGNVRGRGSLWRDLFSLFGIPLPTTPQLRWEKSS